MSSEWKVQCVALGRPAAAVAGSSIKSMAVLWNCDGKAVYEIHEDQPDYNAPLTDLYPGCLRAPRGPGINPSLNFRGWPIIGGGAYVPCRSCNRLDNLLPLFSCATYFFLFSVVLHIPDDRDNTLERPNSLASLNANEFISTRMTDAPGRARRLWNKPSASRQGCHRWWPTSL